MMNLPCNQYPFPAIKVKYEALGKEHVAFAPLPVDRKTITATVKMISNYAFVVSFSVEHITINQLEESGLIKIEHWDRRIKDLEGNEH